MSVLICPKLAIWALSWLMGMFGAGASFLKFFTSGWVTLDRSKCVQTLNLDGVNVGYEDLQISTQHGSLLSTT